MTPKIFSGSSASLIAAIKTPAQAVSGAQRDNNTLFTARLRRSLLNFPASRSEPLRVSTQHQLYGQHFKQDEQKDKAAFEFKTAGTKNKIKAKR